MTVVSDTSPLRYLIAVGQAGLLAKIFDLVLIPPAVGQELLDPHAPLSVQRWMRDPPPWLKTRKLTGSPDDELVAQLDVGEAEAIQLALEIDADVLVIDERRGRDLANAEV
jgi:predicted nucleic acid-binding protein